VAEPADSAGSAPEPVEGELVPADGAEIAEVRHLPVPIDPRATELARPRALSAPAAVAAAAGGFLLGAATFMLIKVLRRPSAARALGRRRSRLEARRRGVDVQATRSFLVDVHLLKR
jgi:hypothetical protein